MLFGDANRIFAKLGRVNCLKKVESHDGRDVIEEEIHDGCVAYVEHKVGGIDRLIDHNRFRMEFSMKIIYVLNFQYDRETLLKRFETSVLSKENKLIENLKKLREEEMDNKTKTKRIQHRNSLESTRGELKKIEQIKKVVDNCSN